MSRWQQTAILCGPEPRRKPNNQYSWPTGFFHSNNTNRWTFCPRLNSATCVFKISLIRSRLLITLSSFKAPPRKVGIATKSASSRKRFSSMRRSIVSYSFKWVSYIHFLGVSLINACEEINKNIMHSFYYLHNQLIKYSSVY